MRKNQVPKSEFKAKALEWFRQVESSGQSIIVTDHGTPAIEIRPYRANCRRPFDILRGSVTHFEYPGEPVAADDWEAAR